VAGDGLCLSCLAYHKSCGKMATDSR
jgi:hypothetical protein